MLPPVLLAAFPDLDTDGGVVTQPPDPGYNCVAWAAGVTDAVWWPADPDAYWPPGVPDELTVDAVVAALATVGYAPLRRRWIRDRVREGGSVRTGRAADTRGPATGGRHVVEQVGP